MERKKQRGRENDDRKDILSKVRSQEWEKREMES